MKYFILRVFGLIVTFIKLHALISINATHAETSSSTQYHLWWIDQHGGHHSTLIDGEKSIELPKLTFVLNEGKEFWGLYKEPIYHIAHACSCPSPSNSILPNQDTLKYPALLPGMMEDQFTTLMDERCHMRRTRHTHHILHQLPIHDFKALKDSQTLKDFIQTTQLDLSQSSLSSHYTGSLTHTIEWVGQLGSLILFNLCQSSYAGGAHGNQSCKAYALDLQRQVIIPHQSLNFSSHIIRSETPKMEANYEDILMQDPLKTPFGKPIWAGIYIKLHKGLYQLFNLWEGHTCFACSSEDWSSYTYRFMTPLSSQGLNRFIDLPKKLPSSIEKWVHTRRIRIYGWSTVKHQYYPALKTWFEAY